MAENWLNKWEELANLWGYRSNNEEHDKYEELTHEGFIIYQQLTDFLMRCLQQKTLLENDSKKIEEAYRDLKNGYFNNNEGYLTTFGKYFKDNKIKFESALSELYDIRYENMKVYQLLVINVRWCIAIADVSLDDFSSELISIYEEIFPEVQSEAKQSENSGSDIESDFELTPEQERELEQLISGRGISKIVGDIIKQGNDEINSLKRQIEKGNDEINKRHKSSYAKEFPRLHL